MISNNLIQYKIQYLPATYNNEISAARPIKKCRANIKSPYQSTGRNNKSKTITPTQPEVGRVICQYPDMPHNFEQEEFVMHKDDSNVFKITMGKMLQKCEPVVGQKGMYETSKSYAGYANEECLRALYKPILMEPMRFQNKIIFKMPERYQSVNLNEASESETLYHYFRIYVQAMISQSFNNSFLESVKEVEYFSNALEQIDYLISTCRESILEDDAWNEILTSRLDRFPQIKVEEMIVNFASQYRPCQASKAPNTLATRYITLSGPKYDPASLAVQSQENEKVTFMVSDKLMTDIITYHGLKHFKFNLLQECEQERQFQKWKELATLKKPKEDCQELISACLADARFTTTSYDKLKELCQKSGVEFEAVLEEY